jgi:hypothetical protein
LSAATTAADDLLDAIGELYGNGDIRFDSETPRRVAVEARAALLAEIERLRDRAVCSGCGYDVNEAGACLSECGEGEMIPASDLPWALRQMRAQRDEWMQEAMAE